ncbi:MAG TPA: S-methyl-5'-thioadenosine phosphorylase [Candidatus Nitrosotalea sp.]|nr:S-methyl-5'-thioadenosine phosphorylase [Candidatus Nitrosotalea sp.]
MTEQAEIGIFGGTGIYDPGLLSDSKEITIETPFGKTSDSITVGTYKGRRVAFMPRHGRKHTIPPHMINFRANIWAFKEMGIKRIIAPSAVGSLQEKFKPGDFAIPTQFIDFTKSRKYTFFEDGKVVHISVADPFCPEMQTAVYKSAEKIDLHLHKDATYVCIEGPRFSTRAESRFYKDVIGAHIIGMTLVPECQLAREAQMCYVSISTVTDYDVWAQKPVTAKEVLETLSKNVHTTKNLLGVLLEAIPQQRGCSCSKALEEAGL